MVLNLSARIGAWVEGEAHMLEGEERDRVLKVFKKEYGRIGYSMVSFVGRLSGERLTAVISIKLQSLLHFSNTWLWKNPKA
jgi:hypothetical protein